MIFIFLNKFIDKRTTQAEDEDPLYELIEVLVGNLNYLKKIKNFCFDLS